MYMYKKDVGMRIHRYRDDMYGQDTAYKDYTYLITIHMCMTFSLGSAMRLLDWNSIVR